MNTSNIFNWNKGDICLMNYHLISDDSFFLLGIREVIENLSSNCFVHNVNSESRLFYPMAGDVVIITVNDLKLRSLLLRNPKLKRCRLLVMMDIPVLPVRLSYFPWLIPKNISTEALLKIINKAVRSMIYRKKVDQKTISIFDELCTGKSTTNLAMTMEDNLKYIYKIKRDIFREYGLLKCNSLGLLLCRDILCKKPSY